MIRAAGSRHPVAGNGLQGPGEQSRKQRGGSQSRGTDQKHGKRNRAEARPEEPTSNQPRAAGLKPAEMSMSETGQWSVLRRETITGPSTCQVAQCQCSQRKLVAGQRIGVLTKET